MRQKLALLASAAALLAAAGCAKSPPPPPPPTVTTAALEGPNTVGNAALLTATARVVSVDKDNRSLVLRGPRGRNFTVDVGPDVKNFDQIRRGDNVVVQYYESVAYTLNRPNAATPPNSVDAAAAAAPPGALPAGVVGRQITVTGLVTAVDLNANTVTLVNPKGGGQTTFHVTDPQRQQDLKSVKRGDTITATITQALAISVERVAPTGRQRHQPTT